MDKPQNNHPRLGYRKPGAKRATLALRMTDENKAMLKAQGAAAGKSVSDHVVALAREYADNPFLAPYPTPPRTSPSCPKCKAPSGSTAPDYGAVSWDVLHPEVQEAIDKGLIPFACLECGHSWFGRYPPMEDECVCTGCGCTDSQACPEGCWWVTVDREKGIGTCSNCAGNKK